MPRVYARSNHPSYRCVAQHSTLEEEAEEAEEKLQKQK